MRSDREIGARQSQPGTFTKKVALVASAEMTVRAFLVDHIAALSKEYSVTVIVNTRNLRFLEECGLNVEVRSVRIERDIRPWRDLRALLQLSVLFLVHRFDVVYSITPKAGLLAMLSAKLAQVPVRIHTFTGQVWATRQGVGRMTLKRLDMLIAASATHLLTDSKSQREFLIAEGVVPGARIDVLGHGSSCGVDVDRFRPDENANTEVRQELGIPWNARVMLFLGRMNCDKGLVDLAKAFVVLSEQGRPDLYLLIVGPDEERLQDNIQQICGRLAVRLRFLPHTDRPERYMAASDVYCLPSYREGLPMGVIEAAAVGVPAVGSRIYGITDAIEAGVTGLLHEPRDVPSLASSLGQLLDSTRMREAMGSAARERVIAHFQRAVVTRALVDYVNRAVARHFGSTQVF